jgi:diguanylate cyclase (GGDEF)-like protein
MMYLNRGNELCSLMADYGQFLFEQNHQDLALDVFYEASLILLDHNNCDSELTVYLYLAKLYELKDNYPKAYDYFKHYHELKSIKDETWKTIKIKNIVNKYEYLRSDLKVKELENTNHNIRIISAIGREITSKIELRQVISKVAEKIYELFDSNVFVVGVLQNNTLMDLIMHNGTEETQLQVSNHNKRWYIFSLLDEVVKNNNFNRSEIMRNQLAINNKVFHGVKSFISSPLIYNDNCIGLVMIQNSKPEAYLDNHIEVLKILSSYISIAVHNSAQSNVLFETNIKLKELTERDGLTKVYNRYALNKNLKRIIRKAYTYEKPFGIIMIDVDFFKEYNDNYGHLAGDQVLIKVSKTLSKIIKPLDNQSQYNFFRYGGDEFVIIVMDKDKDDLIAIGEALRNAVLELKIAHKFSKCSNLVTITAGINVVKQENEDFESLFALADQALYQAKRQGRNNVKILIYE